MKPSEAARLIAKIRIVWPQFDGPRTDAEAQAWANEWAAIIDTPLDVAETAVRSLAVDGMEFPPTPGQIRARAVELKGAVTGDGIPTADEAWAEILAEIAHTGYVGEPTFSHQAITDVVTGMGWKELCWSQNQMADRAHFMKMYAVIRDRHVRIAHAPAAVRDSLGRGGFMTIDEAIAEGDRKALGA